jgi:hypothetical protein
MWLERQDLLGRFLLDRYRMDQRVKHGCDETVLAPSEGENLGIRSCDQFAISAVKEGFDFVVLQPRFELK